MANTTHFAGKLPQVEEHGKPHSIHQDYGMQLQLCCSQVAKGSRPCLSVEHGCPDYWQAAKMHNQWLCNSCAFCPCTTPTLGECTQGNSKKTSASYNFLLSGMSLPQYNTIQCIIYLQSSQDAVLSASQLLTSLCWCHRPPLGNPLAS